MALAYMDRKLCSFNHNCIKLGGLCPRNARDKKTEKMLLYLDLVKPVTLCIHLLQISVLHNKTQDAVVEGRLRPSAATW